MGSTDFGSQTITIDYEAPLRASSVNKINYELHQKGIYNGGTLTKVDADTVRLSALTCYIIDSSTGNGVRVETSSTVDVDVTETTADYIVLRYNWSNAADNYMDVLAVAYADIDADDIIVGKACFHSSTLQSTFDYTRRTTAHVADLETNDQELRVVSQNPPANTVYIYGGTIRGVHNEITVTSGNSPTISATTLGRYDIVWIDDSGAIQVTEGSDSGSPSAPDYDGKYVIAEIQRDASRSVVDGDEIVWVNPVHQDMLYELTLTSNGDGASLIGIEDTGGYFTGTDVETALQELFDGTATFNIDSGTIDGVTLGTNSAITEAQIDNLNLNGDAITPSGSDGSLTIISKGASNYTNLTLSSDSSNDYGLIGSRGNMYLLQNAYYDGAWKSISATPAAAGLIYQNVGSSIALSVQADTSVSGVDETLSFIGLFTVETDGEVDIGGSTLRFNHDGSGFSDATADIYFDAGAILQWKNNDYFNFNRQLSINYSGGSSLYLNFDGDSTWQGANSSVYFEDGKYLQWDNTNTHFNLVGGDLSLSADNIRLNHNAVSWTESDAVLYFGDGDYHKWDNTNSKHVFSHDISISGDALYLNHTGAAYTQNTDGYLYMGETNYAGTKVLRLYANTDTLAGLFNFNSTLTIDSASFYFNHDGSSQSNDDALIYFASDATVGWDESDDALTNSKRTKAAVHYENAASGSEDDVYHAVEGYLPATTGVKVPATGAFHDGSNYRAIVGASRVDADTIRIYYFDLGTAGVSYHDFDDGGGGTFNISIMLW